MNEPYKRLSYEERKDRFDDNYDVLVGPDGFECMLGEPEDRTWGRDGKQVVARLNEQHAEIERMRAECALYLQERQAIRDLFPACLDEYGPTLLEAITAEVKRLRTENATLLESGGKAEYRVAKRSDCRA